MATDSETTTTKRAAVSKRTFVNAAGEYTGRVDTTSVGFKVELLGNGAVLERKLSDYPQEVINAAALFGLVTSLTNTFGGMSDPDEMADAMTQRDETFQGGEWSSERQTGPRTSDLLDAVVAFRAKNGKETTEEWKQGLAAKLAAKETTSKDILAEPAVNAEYLAIKAKRAAERSAAATAAVSGTTTSSALLD